MANPTEEIPVTHVGSLPRTEKLLAATEAREVADDGFTLKSTPEFERLLAESVTELVAAQQKQGITVPGDGEYGKAVRAASSRGTWWSYIFQRVSGLELTGESIHNQPHVESAPGDLRLTSFTHRRDRALFPDYYFEPAQTDGNVSGAVHWPATTGELKYTGQDLLASDIANFKTALKTSGFDTGFLTSLSPGSAARLSNDFYATDEEHVYAWAEVLREEYKAITDAGLIVQIDDPAIADNFDLISPEPSIEDYQVFTQIRVDALNYALRDLPEDQIRFHVCWGSWRGPHTTDIEFRHLIDLVLSIRAKYYSFEAANARHEHEYVLWDEVRLPEGKVILPGVISHATNVVEHPELVAQRIIRFAERVGKENVIASTDCGLGGRLHPQIANAKLETLSRGATLATQRLWNK